MSLSDEWIASYLDDSLTDEQAIELREWLHADRGNLRNFALAVARDELLRTAVNSTETLSAATARHQVATTIDGHRNLRRGSYIAGWIIALGVLVCVGWFVMPRRTSTAIPTFVGSNRRVTLRDSAGIVNELQPGDRFTIGNVRVEGDGGRARFVYADGSEFILAGASEVALESVQQQGLVLRHGALRATVSPQPRHQPWVVRTSTAEAAVLGTSFAINASDTETLLQVSSGSVSFRRLSDDQTVTVSESQQARVSRRARNSLHLVAVVPVQTHWKATTNQQQYDWLGDWESNILNATPRSVFLKDTGVEETHFHAGARNSFPGLVTLEEGSVIRIRYRIERPLNLGLFISTHAPSWDFTGNFQAYVEERNTPPDGDGWRIATMPIGVFKPMARTAIPFKPGCIIATIYATTFNDDVGLEIAELEVVPQRK
ncbi:FecR domain-containing protein [Roseiconus lacunae]|uniref:FecR family protein n=1 Tax=Roseiconus lacunae TaxID=2605694 RepID=A0ABT7PIZ6_9BACT|nr:FecR family protein [Roseiconus lacunae]MDM4016469.1 FecR family protein [Roseiconus lacunae]